MGSDRSHPFGESASETEAQTPSLFTETEFSEIALQRETYLIVGRRGSGKTALARYLTVQNRLNDPLVIAVDEPMAYQAVLADLASGSSALRELAIPRLTRAWEYVIWSIIFQQARARVPNLPHSTLVSAAPGQDISATIQKLFAYLTGLFSESTSPSVEHELLSDERFTQARDSVLAAAVHRPIILTIDSFERYDTDDEALMIATAALIECAANFNASYSERGVHVKVFLAGEIFPHLRERVIPNPLKSVRAPLFLLWKPKDLLRVICWRLYSYLRANDAATADTIGPVDWSNPREIMQKLWRPFFGWEVTDAQGLQEQTFPFILRHTQSRPRQLILACNAIAKRAVRRGTFPRVEEVDIRRGVEEAEVLLASEVLNAYSGVQRNVAKIASALMGVKATFPARELDRHARASAPSWTHEPYSAANFRELVAEMGIVGRVVRRDDGARYVAAEFEYATPERLSLTPNDECAVHPMFHQRLNVRTDRAFWILPFESGSDLELAEVEERRYAREAQVFLRLSRRAETVDRSQLVDTFVGVGPLMTMLRTADHQIVYGRRGTGKTHALLYLESAVRADADLSAYVDLRNMGSTSGADAETPFTERAARLLKDVLGTIHTCLLDQVNRRADLPLERIAPALDDFADACAEMIVSGTIQSDESVSTADGSTTRSGLRAVIGRQPSLSAEEAVGSSHTEQQALRVTRSGLAQNRVHFGRVGTSLRSVVEAINPHRIWIFLDEWSVIPRNLQPVLADFVRRSLFPLPGVTVKIGAIEYRTRFREVGPGGEYVGIEVGADAAADLNLDDFMVYEENPERATRFFLELFYRAVQPLNGEIEPAQRFHAPSEVLRAFTRRSTFEEFVRAAEGVPRDAINILITAAQRSFDVPISLEDVRTAARAWYQRDKLAAAATNIEARRLLNWIVEEVVGRRGVRGFLLRADDYHPLIDALFDARVLHLLKRDIGTHDDLAARYDAYKLDYGSYVDLLETARAPRGLFVGGESDGAITYTDKLPSDARAVQHSFLDLGLFESSS